LLRGMLVATLVFLLAGEALARVTGLLDRLNGYTHLLFAPGPDIDLPYLLRPNLNTSLSHVAIRTNAYGLRGGEVQPRPPAGTRRILLLGDSVVFGQEIPEEQTVGAMLARAAANLGLGPTEVINAGVPGYDTVAEVRLLERVGLGLGPHAVVVGLSLNDHDVAPQYSPFGLLISKPLEQRQPAWTDRSEFLALLRWVGRWLRGDLFVQLVAVNEAQPGPAASQARPRPPAVEAGIRDLRLAFYRNPVPAHWERLRGALVSLRTVCADHGVRPLVAIFPEAFQVETSSPDVTPQTKLLALCREVDVDCLDLLPSFRAAGGELFLDVSRALEPPR
jgi:lysophospholipase L1-like esterase